MYPVSNDFISAMLAPVIQSKIVGTIDETAFTEANILSGSLRIYAQNSGKDSIDIGTASAKELNITLMHSLNLAGLTLSGKEIALTYKLLIAPNTYEDVPLGTYIIAEANRTLKGIEIVAYDYMSKFDALFDDTTAEYPITGKAYDQIEWLCDQRGVELGMTEAEMDALPNGTTMMEYVKDAASSYREYIAFLAAALGCYAIIDRTDKLIFKRYSDASYETYGAADRLTGAKFSDFMTRYNGFYVTDFATSKTVLVQTTSYAGLKMDLGKNPFLNSTQKASLRQNVLTELANINFAPFSAKFNFPPIYDLGDCVKLTGGIGDNNAHVVNYWSWQYNQSLTLEGYGSNPALATAQTALSQRVSSLETLTNSLAGRIGDEGKYGIIFLSPISPTIDDLPFVSEESIDDGDTQEVVYYEFDVTDDKAPAAPHIVIDAEVETTVENDEYTDCEVAVNIQDGDIEDGEETNIQNLAVWSKYVGDGKITLNIDALRKEYETGKHFIRAKVGITGGMIDAGKMAIRTAYLETRPWVVPYMHKVPIFPKHPVPNPITLVDNLDIFDKCRSRYGDINYYSNYFLDGKPIWLCEDYAKVWRINGDHKGKWSALPVSGGSTTITQVSGEPVFATVLSGQTEPVYNVDEIVLLASKDGQGTFHISGNTYSGDHITAWPDTMAYLGASKDGYFYPYYQAQDAPDLIAALKASGYVYYRGTSSTYDENHIPLEGWSHNLGMQMGMSDLEMFAMNDFLGTDEYCFIKYASTMSPNYQPLEKKSYMYIPITRSEGFSKVTAWGRIFNREPVSPISADKNVVGIGAGAVVNGQMQQIIETTSSSSWDAIEVDISGLPYVDYIILYGYAGVSGIKGVYLNK